MLYNKPATTIDQQVDFLIDRGMIIDDQNLVQRWLSTVGYYRLSAYWLWFENPPQGEETRSKQFREGTRFEDIISLYVFDRQLRLLVTEAIERIEIAFRARWTNRLSLAHGSHAHMQREAFVPSLDHIHLLAKISWRYKDSSEVFVEHYSKKYTEPVLPPIWIVTELMTFGELSKWFAATRDLSLKSAVASDLGLPSREVLDGTLQLLSYVRNICAHHGRLWNRRTVKRLPYIKRFRDDIVIKQEGEQSQSENYIYNVLVALIRLLQRQSPDTTFARRARALVAERPADQLKAMGFPNNWQDRPCWKIKEAS